MNIKILLADDHKIMREGLKSILEKNFNMIVSGEAGNGVEAVDLAKKLNPDIIIMDINMPDLNGIEATKRIITEIPGSRILALSMYADRGFLIKMLKAGAKGYLLKDCASDELLNAIKVILKNRIYISPSLVDDMVRDYVQLADTVDLSAFSILTPRERDVLQKLSEGKSTKEIAFDLNLSIKTIETFRLKIQEKIGLRSIAELTKYAVREGITSL
ncbi:MAG TPA: response regulator transcription factor [Desulfomonilia bacterium]